MEAQTSIDLYFKIDRLHQVFEALVEMADRDETHHVSIILPDHQIIDLPFHASSNRISLQKPNDTLNFDISFLCPLNERLATYVSNGAISQQLRHEFPFCVMPDIHVFIRLGHQFVHVSFEPPTIEMEELFLHERMVQVAFLDYFKLAHGSIAVIHSRQAGLYYALENPSMTWNQELTSSEDLLSADALDRLAQRLSHRYDSLDMEWSNEDVQVEFYIKWIQPYYVEVISGTPVDADFDASYAEKTRSALANINEEIFDRLYSDTNWRSHAASYWLAGVSRRSNYTQRVGIALRARPAHARGQIFALTRFNNPLAVFHLKRYLEEILHTEGKPFDDTHGFSWDWALAALILFDSQNGTHNADPYIEINGVLDRYTERRAKHIEEKYSFDRDWVESFKADWQPRKYVNDAKLSLQRALNFASTYFPEY